MKLFNKKQIEILEPYEEHFHTVLFAKYKRLTTSRVNDIVANTYEDATGEIVDRNWSCGTCVYNLFAKVGKLYYTSKEELNKVKEETKTIEKKVEKKKRTKTTKNK